MKILFAYTKRVLLQNKARTIVTIAGIVLSFALFTAVLTGISSGIQYLVEGSKAGYGDWHGLIYQAEEQTKQLLEEQYDVTEHFSVQDLWITKLPEDASEFKPYGFIGGIDASFIENMNLRLVNGKFPETEDELIVPSNLYHSNVRLSTGDVITLDIGYRQSIQGSEISHNVPYCREEETFVVSSKKTFTIVGVYECDYIVNFESACKDLYTIKQDRNLKEDLFFRVKEPNDLQERLKISFPEYTTKINENLLRFLGYDTSEHGADVYEMISGFAIILCLLVVFISISLIYNAFAISLGERTKQFGLLKSIGATKLQIRWMVWIEAGLLCIISIPIGLLVGCGGVWIVLKLLKEPFAIIVADVGLNAEIAFSTEPFYLCMAAVVGTITVMISAFIPAIRANAITPVDAIRQTNDVKISSKQVRGGQKLFGIAGILAYKNAKRNKKPYRSIIFSIASSLILFLAGGGLVTYMNFYLQYEFEHADYDFRVSYSQALSEEEQHAIATYLNEKDSINNFYLLTQKKLYFTFGSHDNLTNVGQIYVEKQGNALVNRDNILVNVYYINDVSYLSLLEQLKLDKTEYFDADVPKAIGINYIVGTYFGKNGSEKHFAGEWFKEEKTTAQNSLWSIANLDNYTSFYMTLGGFGFYKEDMNRIEHTIEEVKHPLEISIGTWLSKEAIPSFIDTISPAIVLPMKAMENTDFGMLANWGTRGNSLFIYAKDYDMAAKDIYAMQQHSKLPIHNGINDVRQYMGVLNAILSIVQVFLMCFVVVLCMIAIANITNTIATSVRLRTREYAMLQSIGMDTKTMYRYVLFENLSYTIKAGVIGIVVGIIINYITAQLVLKVVSINFFLPVSYYMIAICGLGGVIVFSVLYTVEKTKKNSLCDKLRNEVW